MYTKQHLWEHAGITTAGKIQLAAFCAFEFSVGVFWPSMMKMRSQHVPEEMRATIINFFRIPLNLFVCVVLQNVRNLHPSGRAARACIFILASCGKLSVRAATCQSANIHLASSCSLHLQFAFADGQQLEYSSVHHQADVLCCT